MNKHIYETIYSLLRIALWGEELYPFTDQTTIDWDTVNQELRHQTVHNLPVDILSKVDTANSKKYFDQIRVAISLWYTIMQEQQKLYNLFQKEDIPFVILKGCAADCYYPKPLYRSMGDIDFIVKPEDFDRAAKCMIENGYEIVNDSHQRHIEYRKNSILLELHRYFGVLEEDESATWMDQLIFNAIEKRNENSIEGFTFPMLPSFENGLVLLIHINQHMESGLGLRQIIDWMLYVEKEMTDEFWNTSFGPAAEKIGLKTLAITTTKMCQMYLGLSKKLDFCQEADSALCEELMNYVMEQGNFGRKRGQSRNTAIRILGIKNIILFFTTLQQKGANNWPTLKKYPYLKPFAWAYQLGRYIYFGFKRETPIRQLRIDFLQSKLQEEFLCKLGITRRTNKIERSK